MVGNRIFSANCYENLKLWKQAAKQGSKRWNEVMDELLKLDFTIDPTFNIYEANRELMLARRAEWHVYPNYGVFISLRGFRTARIGKNGERNKKCNRRKITKFG